LAYKIWSGESCIQTHCVPTYTSILLYDKEKYAGVNISTIGKEFGDEKKKYRFVL